MTSVEVARAHSNLPAAEDCELVRNLLQAYCVFVDNGLNAEAAALFTDDGTWNGDDLGYGAAVGPADIVELLAGHYDPEQPMFHFGGPPILQSTSADELRSYSWAIAGRASGPTTIYFHYEDVLRRHPERGWLIASRRLVGRRHL